jgi:membrane associated rhomboid family serine protease
VGWQERHYSENAYDTFRATRRGLRRPPNGTLALMVVHGLAYLLVLALGRGGGADIAGLTALPGSAAGILLHPLSTERIFRVVFVVLALWSLGGRIETRLGARRLMLLYVAGNLLAGVVYWVLARNAPALATAPLDYAAGALAALCLTAWWHLRDDSVQVLRWVTSMARVYAICAAIVVGLAFLEASAGATAWLVAALAGGGSAWVIEHWPARVRRARPRRAVRGPAIPPLPTMPGPPDEPDIDDILAKISREGIGSLTDAERERLENARRAKLRHSR